MEAAKRKKKERELKAQELRRVQAEKKKVKPLPGEEGYVWEPDLKYIEECEVIYKKIVSSFPLTLGKSTSRRDRRENPNFANNQNYIYSEIEFKSLGIIFQKIINQYALPNIGTSGDLGMFQKPSGSIFYDLGSGTGKVVIAAACLYNFSEAIGIENLDNLFVVSQDLMTSYNTKGKQLMDDARKTHTLCSTYLADFQLVMKGKDWRNGDMIFANSTNYDDKTMNKIALLARNLGEVSQRIPFTSSLIGFSNRPEDWKLIDYVMMPVSFGEATVYIQQKVTDPWGEDSDEEKEKDEDEDEDDKKEKNKAEMKNEVEKTKVILEKLNNKKEIETKNAEHNISKKDIKKSKSPNNSRSSSPVSTTKNKGNASKSKSPSNSRSSSPVTTKSGGSKSSPSSLKPNSTANTPDGRSKSPVQGQKRK